MKTIKTPDNQLVPAVVLVDSQGRVLTPGSVFDSTGVYSFDVASLPKAYTYDGGNNVATITYGPDVNGRKITLTRTWNGALLQSESAYVLAGTAASTLTLSGANTAVVGNPSADITVTVGPAGSYFSPFTFTPTDGGAGGYFKPESVSLSYGQRSATFKYTPLSEGVKTLAGTVDQGSLVVAATFNFTASVPGKALAPAQVTATVDGTSVTLTWPPVPDASNGGSPVSQYLAKLSTGEGKLLEPTVRTWTFRNLTPNVAVTGSVAAVTKVGVGNVAVCDPVTPVDGSTPVPTKPGQPAKPVLTAMPGAVSLAWTPGAAGSTATTGNVWTDINGNTTALTTNPQVITAPAGTPYTGTVKTQNAQGFGLPSVQADAVTPTAAQTYLTSAATRLAPSAGLGTAGANNVRTSRLWEFSVVPVPDPIGAVGNWWVDTTVANGPQELATGNVVTYAAAFETNISGIGLNQSAATLTPLTWQKAAAGEPGYLVKLDGTPATGAEFIAAGGTLSGDSLRIGVPNGWTAWWDPAIGLTLFGAYFFKCELSVPTGLKYAGSSVAARADLGDYNKDSTVGTSVFVKDWTTIGTVLNGNAVAPLEIIGLTPYRTVGFAGDSIMRDNFDRDASTNLYGDSRGAVGFGARAASGVYPMVKTAVSGANAQNPYTYGGYNMRAYMHRFCKTIITDMGHNDRAASPSNIMLFMRAHWAKLRSVNLYGTPRVVQATWAPSSALVSFTLSSITSSGTVATGTTPSTANMAVGRTISINNAAPAAFGGQVVVTGILDANRFTYTIADQSGASATTPGSFTDLYATKAGQQGVLAGTLQYDFFNPFIKAGVFNGTTDCDAGYDLEGDCYAAATALGATDVTRGYIPTNGVANYFWNDSVHMKSIMHVGVAGRLKPKLPALLGF